MELYHRTVILCVLLLRKLISQTVALMPAAADLSEIFPISGITNIEGKDPLGKCAVCMKNNRLQETKSMSKDCDFTSCIMPCFGTFHIQKCIEIFFFFFFKFYVKIIQWRNCSHQGDR